MALRTTFISVCSFIGALCISLATGRSGWHSLEIAVGVCAITAAACVGVVEMMRA